MAFAPFLCRMIRLITVPYLYHFHTKVNVVINFESGFLHVISRKRQREELIIFDTRML